MVFLEAKRLILLSFVLSSVAISQSALVESTSEGGKIAEVGVSETKNFAQPDQDLIDFSSTGLEPHVSQPDEQNFPKWEAFGNHQMKLSLMDEPAKPTNFYYPASAWGSLPISHETGPINQDSQLVRNTGSQKRAENLILDKKKFGWKDLFAKIKGLVTWKKRNSRPATEEDARGMIKNFEEKLEKLSKDLNNKLVDAERLRREYPDKLQKNIYWNYDSFRNLIWVDKKVKRTDPEIESYWLPKLMEDFKEKNDLVKELVRRAVQNERFEKYDEAATDIEEASRIAKLNHENCVSVIEAGFDYRDYLNKVPRSERKPQQTKLRKMKSKLLKDKEPVVTTELLKDARSHFISNDRALARSEY